MALRDYLWKLAFRRKVGDVGFVEGCEGDVSDGEYHWYDVLTWVPAPDEYFWMGPGRFTPDGKTAINGKGRTFVGHIIEFGFLT